MTFPLDISEKKKKPYWNKFLKGGKYDATAFFRSDPIYHHH